MGKFEYTDGETTFEGYIAEPQAEGRRPVLMVAHAWDGPNAYFNALTDKFARLGYLGFAIDVYGKGVRGKIDGDNSHLMNPLLADRALLRRRLMAAFEEVARHPRAREIYILGYCFGGLCAFDLARANPKGLRGAIGVHAPLGASPSTKIDASILLLHGWEDPFASPEAILGFAQEMTRAQADWQIHAYGHAKHAFTFEGADIPELGIKYDEKAHRRAEKTTLEFLKELTSAYSGSTFHAG